MPLSHGDGGDGGRISVSSDGRDERGGSQLAEHVETVVGGGSVGAQTHVHTRVQHALHRRQSAAQLQVAARTVHRRGTVLLQQRNVAVEHVHAVRANGSVQQSQTRQIRDRRALLVAAVAVGALVVARHAVLQLRLRLLHVDVHRNVEPLAHRANGAQRLVIVQVRRVRTHRVHHTIVLRTRRQRLDGLGVIF